MLVGARLNWLLSHGKGKTWGGKSSKDWGGQKFIQIDISPTEADSNVRIDAPLVGDVGSCVSARSIVTTSRCGSCIAGRPNHAPPAAMRRGSATVATPSSTPG